MKDFPVGDLVEWFRENKRDLPWRKTEDPYEIWVAEIMLQQTQVTTVLDYYQDFLEAFPTVEDLAEATQDEVLKAWEGMGFYARARRLHSAAGQVVREYGGQLPEDENERLDLPGIGEYTTAAIGAFAFDQASPVMDSNVERVIARWEGIETPVDRSDTQSRIESILEGILRRAETPGTVSESVMELGALVCTARNPDCSDCPLRESCEAFRTDRQSSMPVTRDSVEKPHHEIAVGVVEEDGEILISRRPEDAMLGGLWEFPGGKREDRESMPEALKRELKEELGVEVSVGEKIETVPHQYSHLSINLHAYWCSIESGTPRSREGQKWTWVRPGNLSDYAFPKANKTILELVQKDFDPDHSTTRT